MPKVLDEHAWGIWSRIIDKAFKAKFSRTSIEEHLRLLIRGFKEREVGLYIHFPFCRSFCKYCPYYRELWNEKAFMKYWKALLQEVKLLGEILSELDLIVVDAHAGGGTPSLGTPSFWREVLEELKSSFEWRASFGIEVNPEDLAKEDIAFGLAEAGVDEVSIGGQSFHRSLLKELGRRHDPEDVIHSIENAREAGFKLINLDLMFAIPNQDPNRALRSWVSDVETAAWMEPHQVTIYPTLMTPQCIAWSSISKGLVSQPVNMLTDFIRVAKNILERSGYSMVRIESWSRGGDYSTVNLEMVGPLLALGPGAMGFTSSYEWANVHSVSEYVRCLGNNKLPVAVSRSVSDIERAARIVADQLFCRGMIREECLVTKTGVSFSELPRGLKFCLKIMEFMGMIEDKGNVLKLTDKGLIQAHKMIWAFVLKVPCKIAEQLMDTPWPHEVIVP